MTMVENDIIERYQTKLLQGNDNNSAQRDRSTPSYAPLQSRLSSYKTYQEKTKLAEVDLPAYDIGDFHMSVLNDRGPEPLTIDDIPRDSNYIRNTVMNIREYGQRSNLSPFLNEVQLYETQQDARGTENIPTDRLRAQMFLAKKDFYKRNLYVDDIGNMRTEQVSDFERRDLINAQNLQSMKRTILFDNETLNYNTLKGAINPLTTENMTEQSVKRYDAINDQQQYQQKYQIKQKTYQDIHNDKFNFQAVPDHQILVADYSQVFTKNSSAMPLNYLYAFSKQKQLDKQQFEAQQKEYNCMQKEQIMQYIQKQSKVQNGRLLAEQQEQDQEAPKSLITQILNKIKMKPKAPNQQNERETKPIHHNFEILIQIKKQHKDMCNQYYNRLQCVEDQMKVLNIDSNLIYRLPHQVDQKAVAELQVIEDFLVVAREAPRQTKQAQQRNNQYMQQETQFDQHIATLAEKYLSNIKQIPSHLVKYLNNQQEQQQDMGKNTFQGNRQQLQASLKRVLSFFKPEQQQVIKEQKQQLLLSQPFADMDKNRKQSQQTAYQFEANQDPKYIRNLINPSLATLKKQSNLNPQSFAYNDITDKYEAVSNNQINVQLSDAPLNATRAPQHVASAHRFNQYKESNVSEVMQGN